MEGRRRIETTGCCGGRRQLPEAEKGAKRWADTARECERVEQRGDDEGQEGGEAGGSRTQVRRRRASEEEDVAHRPRPRASSPLLPSSPPPLSLRETSAARQRKTGSRQRRKD